MTQAMAILELKAKAMELGIVIKEVAFLNVHTFEHERDRFTVVDRIYGIRVSPKPVDKKSEPTK